MIKKPVQLAFDLSTEQLEKIYSVQTGKSYTNAYNDIRKFLEKRGYKHRQGSVYHSAVEKSHGDVITDLNRPFKWHKKTAV